MSVPNASSDTFLAVFSLTTVLQVWAWKLISHINYIRQNCTLWCDIFRKCRQSLVFRFASSCSDLVVIMLCMLSGKKKKKKNITVQGTAWSTWPLQFPERQRSKVRLGRVSHSVPFHLRCHCLCNPRYQARDLKFLAPFAGIGKSKLKLWSMIRTLSPLCFFRDSKCCC